MINYLINLCYNFFYSCLLGISKVSNIFILNLKSNKDQIMKKHQTIIENKVDRSYNFFSAIKPSIDGLRDMECKNMFDLIKEKELNKLQILSTYQLMMYDHGIITNEINQSIDELCTTLNRYLNTENDEKRIVRTGDSFHIFIVKEIKQDILWNIISLWDSSYVINELTLNLMLHDDKIDPDLMDYSNKKTINFINGIPLDLVPIKDPEINLIKIMNTLKTFYINL